MLCVDARVTLPSSAHQIPHLVAIARVHLRRAHELNIWPIMAHDHVGGAGERHCVEETGWSISAIARHLEKDRKTTRSYLKREAAVQIRYRRGNGLLKPHLGQTSKFL